jgi:ankyrin repeat protein
MVPVAGKEVVDILVEFGADIDQKNAGGRTALDEAIRVENQAMVDILEKISLKASAEARGQLGTSSVSIP